MAPMREGDWICPACQNHNFASRQTCNKCAGPHPGGAGGGFAAVARQPQAMQRHSPYGMQPVLQREVAGAPAPRPGDWQCQACGANVFASKSSCFKCGTSKPGEGVQFSPPPAMRGGGCGGGGGAGSRELKEGDWMCATCDNHNFASRVNCNKCQELRPGMKQGDWICRQCKNHNFASKTACNKCAVPKPFDGEAGAGRRAAALQSSGGCGGCYGGGCGGCGGYGGCKGGMYGGGCCDMYGGKGGMYGGKGGMYGGGCCDMYGGCGGGCDMYGGYGGGCMGGQMVYGCGGKGMQSMMPCMGGGKGMGGSPMMQYGGMPGPMMSSKPMKEGDWMCPGCGNHNFASRVECNKCKALRAGFKTGDWVCRECKNHNFKSRTECNKCQKPKPE